MQTKEEFSMELSRTVEILYDEDRQIIIEGDLNARIEHSHGLIGPFPGEQGTNDNGNSLSEFCVDNGLLIDSL